MFRSRLIASRIAGRKHQRKGQGLVEYIILLSMVMGAIVAMAYLNSPKFRAAIYDTYADVIMLALPQEGETKAAPNPFASFNNDL